MSALRAVLAEVRGASDPTTLDAIARRLQLGRDEVEAMVDYWVGRGQLAVVELATHCPANSCGGCLLRAPGRCGGNRPGSGSTLRAITAV